FLATRILPVAVIDARFFKYDFVFNFGIFTSFFLSSWWQPIATLDIQHGIFWQNKTKNQVFIE
ncbi:MAG: hypothetical protein J6W27_00020, partial [Alphaproteobacteria bacterium]|nr:hypothetical protein [Alphaproteobacteria bacterium]